MAEVKGSENMTPPDTDKQETATEIQQGKKDNTVDIDGEYSDWLFF